MNYNYKFGSSGSNNIFPNDLKSSLNTTLDLRSEYNLLPPSSKCVESPISYDSSGSTYDYCKNLEPGLRYAGLKFFAVMMVHSWRKSKDELMKLQETIANLKRTTLRSNSDIKICSQKMQRKEKRNYELSMQLRKAIQENKTDKTSCESMKTTIVSIRADNALLEQELKDKQEEFDALHAILAQTKTDLFNCRMDQRSLRSQLAKEHINIKVLENQNSKLINEVCAINAEHRKEEEKFNNELKEKELQIQQINEQLVATQTILKNLNSNNEEANNVELTNSPMRTEVEILRCQVESLREKLNNSFGNRCLKLWQSFLRCQKTTTHFFHVLIFYLLPAIPSPYQ